MAQQPKKYEINVENIVSVLYFDIQNNADSEEGNKLDLNLLHRKYQTSGETTYNPSNFPAVIMRTSQKIDEEEGIIKVTALIFSTGKVVVTGIKKRQIVEKMAHQVFDKIASVYDNITFKEIAVKNMVSTASLGYSLDLNLVHITLENATYEPELFPGLVYKMSEPKCTFLIFSSGKLVCTGVKELETANKAIEKLDNLLKDCILDEKDIVSIPSTEN